MSASLNLIKRSQNSYQISSFDFIHRLLEELFLEIRVHWIYQNGLKPQAEKRLRPISAYKYLEDTYMVLILKLIGSHNSSKEKCCIYLQCTLNAKVVQNFVKLPSRMYVNQRRGRGKRWGLLPWSR